jgi:hypothetical protein
VAIGEIAFREDPPAPGKETCFHQQGLVHRISHGKPQAMPRESHRWQWPQNLMTNFKRAMAPIQRKPRYWANHPFAFHLKLRQMHLQLRKPSTINK